MSKFIALSLFATLTATMLATSPATAQEKPTLTIYTYDAFAADWGPAPLLKSGFEASCNCTINFIAASSSIGALRKVQLEGATTQADIVLGLDTSLTGQALATGLFAPHQVDTSSLSVPTNWSSTHFVPFDYGYLALIYNKELLPNPPKSFEQLADKSSGIRFITQDPRSSTPGLGLVLWLKAAYGSDTNEAWPEITPHIVTLTQSWSEAYALFLDGEADMVLSYTTSPAYHRMVENDTRFAAAPFREGHYTQIEVAGILASSPNQPLANDFLTYLISPEAQKIIPTTNWMYPVLASAIPAEFASLHQPEKPLLLDDDAVTRHSGAWIGEMLAAFD